MVDNIDNDEASEKAASRFSLFLDYLTTRRKEIKSEYPTFEHEGPLPAQVNITSNDTGLVVLEMVYVREDVVDELISKAVDDVYSKLYLATIPVLNDNMQ